MTVRIAVAGLGVIGLRHAAALMGADDVTLAAIVDPCDAAGVTAARHRVPHYRTLGDLIAAADCDGVILATPNALHVEQALRCIAAGLPCLVEKPLAIDIAGAEAVVAAAETAGVAVAVGHHRRHNPRITTAKAAIDAGSLGRITAVQGAVWLFKPDPYFDIPWRRAPGAGPIYMNLIHDIDVLRHLVGDIAAVHAMTDGTVRGHGIEETAAILLRFANGALGTLSVSDTVVAPLSWELTARENPAYPATGESCTWIAGTHGALSLPDAVLWHQPHERSWMKPIATSRPVTDLDDPLVRQVRQFAAVIRGEAEPLVSAADGLANQRVIEAVHASAASGQTVAIY
ncbi:Gfo/Idh/MocA family protein [Oceaniglobus indicus]|uniref:Gfo/Idh/MocA family protein n=1 Tax=Oceaniglobus indicus TaxID=2047749 RepID=UPI000C178C05|nr:Gfo/Idh/MocA family oxidoreductase [Oceaniglobus indicus]